jgi:hypothetical protein
VDSQFLIFARTANIPKRSCLQSVPPEYRETPQARRLFLSTSVLTMVLLTHYVTSAAERHYTKKEKAQIFTTLNCPSLSFTACTLCTTFCNNTKLHALPTPGICVFRAICRINANRSPEGLNQQVLVTETQCVLCEAATQIFNNTEIS